MSGRNLGLYTLEYEEGRFGSQWSWSPSKDDFNALIEEQDCFEISLREEKKKTQEQRQEIRRLKKERRNLRDDRDDALTRLAEVEKEVQEQKVEIEELKSKLTQQTGLETRKTLRAVRNIFPENGDGNDEEMNNNEVVVTTTPEKSTPPPTPSSQPPSTKELFKFRKTASLVAQLVQGFEAAAVANTPVKANEMIRRRKTVHGFRTVTFSLQ